MKGLKEEVGLAVALAWPSTYCKQAGSWYDAPARLFGINVGAFYKAGHSALILIHKDGIAKYYFYLPSRTVRLI